MDFGTLYAFIVSPYKKHYGYDHASMAFRVLVQNKLPTPDLRWYEDQALQTMSYGSEELQ